jgi:hypothetical protein
MSDINSSSLLASPIMTPIRNPRQSLLFGRSTSADLRPQEFFLQVIQKIPSPMIEVSFLPFKACSARMHEKWDMLTKVE